MDEITTASRFATLLAVLACASCQSGAERSSTPPMLAAPPALTCSELDFEVVEGQWPEPRWVQWGGRTLLGGGWSAISTGRFGSAQWEHCDTFTVWEGETRSKLQGSKHPLSGLAPPLELECVVPDFALGGELYDFGEFRKEMIGHTRDSAAEKIGWAPVWANEEYGWFGWEVLNVWRSGQWKRVGWPELGMYPGHQAIVLPDGELLLSGGFEWVESPDGFRRRPVAQAATFDGVRWRYVGKMTQARFGHAVVPWREGALAIGGVAEPNEGVPASSSEFFDPTRGDWTPLGPDAPDHLRPAAVAVGDTVLSLDTADDRPAAFAALQGDELWRSVPEPPLAELGAAAWLAVDDGHALLVAAREVALFSVAGLTWETCSVTPLVGGEDPPGKGARTFGPAALHGARKVLLTRIDRDRWYDTED